MPGRVSSRRTTTSVGGDGTRKSTGTTRSARSSAVAAVEIPDEGPDNTLRAEVCRAFAKAQHSTPVQRKVASDLRKVHEACCYEGVKPASLAQMWAEFGESEFNEEFCRCLLRVLPVKKSEGVGDRTVRFLGVFLKFASEKDNAIAAPDDVEETDIFPETPASRLTSQLLSILLPLMTVKDKTVRFRCTQIIAHIINTLDSIDSDLFPHVRLALIKRLRDKEAGVRVQAVLGLGRMADSEESEGNDNENSDSEDEAASARGVLEKLVDQLQHDPSAEVRRSLLLNLPFAPSTLPYLLERARDLDGATRRALYARLLPALGDFRHLSLTHREKLLRWGLRDRDENVRKATARLFRERWIEDCAGSQETEETETDAAPQPQGQQQAAKPNLDALLELLERIDVVNSGVETGIAHEAMREFWDGRPDYCDYISFEDPYWDELTAESSFVARTFNHYCRSADDRKLLEAVEDKMPEVTKFAFLLQRHLNALIQGVQKVALQDQDGPEDVEDAEEDTVQQEFCVEQLLHIALTLDYSDEVGRRQMFSVMREALALAELPEECTKLCIEVLRACCGANANGEREFVGIVLEAIAEVHDTIMGDGGDDGADESFHSAKSEVSDESRSSKNSKKNRDVDDSEAEQEVDEEKAVREIMVNMKCLHIAQCMLQNVQCELEQNSDLVTMLNNLVVPAVRSQEAPIRERGLTCLGLCCLLSKNLAAENLTLFLHCFQKGHEALQVIALQIITDMVTIHPSLLATPPPAAFESIPQSPQKRGSNQNTPGNPILKPLQKSYLRALKSSDPNVQTTGATSLSKLLLAHILPADPVSLTTEPLKALAMAYFDPDSAANPALRQAIAYFLPAYAHSRPSNAEALASVAVPIIHALASVQEDLVDGDDGEDAGDMVSLATAGAALAEWTDPRRLVSLNPTVSPLLSGTEKDQASADEARSLAHLILAEEILERLLTAGTAKDEKKALISMLGKLCIPTILPTSHTLGREPNECLSTLRDALQEAQESKLANEASSRNTLSKVSAAIEKLAEKVSAGDAAANTSSTVINPGASEAGDAGRRESAGSQASHGSAGSARTEAGLTTRMNITAAPEDEGTKIPLNDLDADEDDEDGESIVTAREGDEAEAEADDTVDSLLRSEVSG